jgi:hypothetical protein
MVTSKVASILVCEKCDYNTSRKSSYTKHLLSAKHCQVTFGDELVAKSCIKYKCENCDKNYSSRNGLWKHKKICSTFEVPSIKDLIGNIHTLTKTVMTVVQENKELNKQIIELSKKPNITNCNNTTNSNNKTFNLQFFLNETCKDALSITEFVNSLQLKIQDLEETGRLGYVQGITRIFLNGLKDLDINERPLHCSDAKREVIYIKDTDQWVKDNENKDKLTLAIKTIANQNIKQISKWQKENPNYNDSNSKKNNLYLKIVSNAMSGGTEAECSKNYNTIITNIAKETTIEKDNL